MSAMKKIAAIQMCSSHNVDDNLNVAAQLIKEAAANGAVLAVLPEMFAIIGMDCIDKNKLREDFGQGKIQDFLANEALKNNIWIVGGTIPITAKEANKIKAACIVYDNNGVAVARYDKIHLFDAILPGNECYKESATTEAGDQVVVVDTPFGKLGLAVCYDIRFPGLFTELFSQGAEILALPAAFIRQTGQAHWHVLARSRAIENLCYFIGANQGGTHTNDRKSYGHSFIIDPWGVIVSERDEVTPGVIYAEINLEQLHQFRTSLPIAEHQRIFSDISRLKQCTA